MIRVPTTLIVGAGASAELRFPTGAKLLQDIADLLAFGDQFDRPNGREERRDVIRAYNKLCGRDTISAIDPLFEAAERVRSAAGLAKSIDNVIDQNDDDPLVETIGKIAIAYRILEAEAGSALSPVPDTPGLFDISKIRDTWLFPFAQMMTTDVRRSSLDQIFDNLTIINFNYDRSVEAFLPTMLMAAYGLSHDDARSIASQVSIFHPYGQVGALSWMNDKNGSVPYGWLARTQIDVISRNLRTFSEKLSETDELRDMRRAIQRAQNLVFLGFGFHRQNMRLLTPDDDIQAELIVASTYLEPPPAVETINTEVSRFARPVGSRPAPLFRVFNGKCADLLNQYQLPLTAS